MNSTETKRFSIEISINAPREKAPQYGKALTTFVNKVPLEKILIIEQALERDPGLVNKAINYLKK